MVLNLCTFISTYGVFMYQGRCQRRFVWVLGMSSPKSACLAAGAAHKWAASIGGSAVPGPRLCIPAAVAAVANDIRRVPSPMPPCAVSKGARNV